jgi:thiamine-phosphate pyrophosphorylase
MRTIAKLASPLTWRQGKDRSVPVFYLLTDVNRLADPQAVMERLPRGACILLRHTDNVELKSLARRVIPRAHRLGLKVLLAGDVRLALRLNADGVHLSQHQARLGPLRIQLKKPGFLLTVSAHSHLALWRASKLPAQAIFISPVFATNSHPTAKPLGHFRAISLTNPSLIATIALGGITIKTAKRLTLSKLSGLAAIDGWQQ